MKKLFILIGFCFMVLIVAEVKGQSKNVFLHKQETMSVLGLNQDQQKQVLKLTSQSFADISKLQKDTTLTKFDRNTKISQVYKQRDEDYKQVLTENQWTKLLEMRAAAKK